MFSLARVEDLADAAAQGLAKLNTRVLKTLGMRIAWARKQSSFDRYVVLNEADREAEKLYNEILETTESLVQNPYIGKNIQIEDYRRILVRYYLIVYRVEKTEIRILRILDGRQKELKA